MARRIYVQLTDGAPETWPVAVLDSGRASELSLGALNVRSNDEVFVLVPGADVAEFTVLLPARTEREARRAAPFAIEDDVAVTVDDLHLAIGPREEGGRRRLLACAQDRIEKWTQAIRAAGLEPDALLPDFALLPLAPTMLDLGNAILVSMGERRFSLDAALGHELLQAIANALPAETQVFGASLARRLGRHGAAETDASPLVQLALLSQSSPAQIDLRQGQFANRRSASLPGLAVWRRPAILAAVAALGWSASTYAETRVLNRQSDALQDRARDIYARHFPTEGRVSNPATRIRDRLESAGGGALDFQNAVAALYEGLSEIDGASLSALRYDAETAELRASVNYADYGDDSRLAQALEARGLTAELGDARSSGRSVSGDLRIGAPR